MPTDVEVCPACACAGYVAVGSAAPGFCTRVENAAFAQPPYRVRECERCGLFYRDCTLSAEEFSHYYSLVPARKWEIAGHYPTEAAILARLKTLPERSRILDFGCSSGRLLASLTTTHECHGIEINEEAARAAADKGLRMLRLDDLIGKEAWFDAIILADVFEHLSAPLALLSQITTALTPGGSLIVVTGNGDAPACRRDPAQFWYFREIEHVCMLTRRHAQFLARQLNLDLSEWAELCHYDLSRREKVVQRLQNFVYWQFRRRTLLARSFLNFLPLFTRLREGDTAPTYSCSRDHVLAVFRKR